MKSVFNRILVPVAFNAETTENITHVIGLANDLGCDLHLLNVQIPPTLLQRVKKYFKKSTNAGPGKLAELNLKALIEQFRVSMADGLLLSGSVVVGNYQVSLKKAVITNDIDLVVIPG